MLRSYKREEKGMEEEVAAQGHASIFQLVQLNFDYNQL